MRQVIRAGIILVAVWLCGAGSSFAAGLYDGVWLVNQSNPSKGTTSTFFLSIHQDDAFLPLAGFNLVGIQLDPQGFWLVNLAVLQPNGSFQGTTVGPDGSPIGTVSATFTSPTALTGTAVKSNQTTVTFTGVKLF